MPDIPNDMIIDEMTEDVVEVIDPDITTFSDEMAVYEVPDAVAVQVQEATERLRQAYGGGRARWSEFTPSFSTPLGRARFSSEREPASVDEQKRIATSLLGALVCVDPSTILAGGAVRDWRKDKACKDLDFFMPNRPHLTDEELIDLLSDAVDKNTDDIEGEFEIYRKTSDRYNEETGLRVFALEGMDVPIDIIMYNGDMRPEAYTSTFNMSFNECWMDSEGEHERPAYTMYEDWNVVICRLDTSEEGALERTVAKYEHVMDKDTVLVKSGAEALDVIAKKQGW